MDAIGVNPDPDYHTMPLDRRKSNPMTDEGEQGDTCRICRGEGTPEQPLFYPCKCSGSIKFVHQDCLMEWLSHSQKKYCELCKTSFRFTKLYDKSMPTTLPLPLFLRQVGAHAIKTAGRWLRYILVTFIWMCWLPWSIRQIWRGLFWLADGNWITLQDLKLMAAAEATSATVDAATTITPTGSTGVNPSLNQTSSTFYFDPVGELFNLLTGAPLLKGLLRLLTPKPSLIHPPASIDANSTHSEAMPPSQATRQPSLLSNVESLNSLTKYQAVNNGLIDIFEGQLVCLSIIAAFILVFLIREWVINQQPILNMPNADQVEPQPAPAAQNEEVRQAARRRRRGLRRLPDRDADVAQRPIAVPRQRRAAAGDNMPAGPLSGQTPDQVEDLSGSSRLVPAGHSTEAMGDSDPSMTAPLETQEQPVTLMDLESPPLERGIFDEVADIRRNIEERVHSNLDIRGEDTSSDTEDTDSLNDNNTPSSSSLSHSSSAERGRSQTTDFVFGQPSQIQPTTETIGNAFTFTSPFNAEGTHDLDLSHQDSRPGQTPFEGSNNPWANTQAQTHQETTIQDDVPRPDTAEHSLVDEHQPLVEEEHTSDPSDDDPDSSENGGDVGGEPDSILGHLAGWLWRADEVIPEPNQHPGQADVDAVPNVHGRANLLPPGNPNAAAPAPAAPAAHEPNIQFGIDMNDPNALDDAEDLEGILELIGMEGPLAGMIQNIIFSVFLITLTLSASVWCPYIWGKIAILIMSNPVGVLVRAPLFFISKCGNMIVDLILFVAGLIGFALSNMIKILRMAIVPMSPRVASFFQIAPVENWSMSVSQNSGLRLEKALSGTFFGLRPDLPTFSMQSHHSLQVFKKSLAEVVGIISAELVQTCKDAVDTYQKHGLFGLPVFVFKEVVSFPEACASAAAKISNWYQLLSEDLRMRPLSEIPSIELSLIEWTTKDKVIAVLIGYAFFAASGYAYLKIAHFLLGLRKDEKVDGVFADSLRQAGGVLKVIVIIGIEMIAFPLYCGLLLDFALLPLFKDASFQSRLNFMLNAPVTCLFIHWFVGTCYMFHFALFVSMCRKIMRKGVLYFIRDPDDPTFHPVRDVLERPVATQLGKIAFSALVYGGLVLVCLGGVVWTISGIQGILPIQWATSEPRLGFPADIVFYNFMLPFILRKAEPSKKISVIYDWWFRQCAKSLRLSHFLFGEERDDEKQGRRHFWRQKSQPDAPTPIEGDKGLIGSDGNAVEHQQDGKYVRAPAADSVRVPKGTKVFVEVNEYNERVDGEPDRDTGMHGRKDERFIKIYIPPHFRARVSFFVFLVWLFAASTGTALTVVPLLVGRQIIYAAAATTLAPNDLYAYTVGIHICVAAFYICYLVLSQKERIRSAGTDVLGNTKGVLPHIYRAIKHAAGLAYLFVAVFVVLPFATSLLTELYVHMPIYSYLASRSSSVPSTETTDTPRSSSPLRPTIFVLQTWTLGLLYLRLILRLTISYPNGQNRASNALRAIVRNGYFHPDVPLASRALVLPALTACVVLLAAPIGLSRLVIVVTGTTDGGEKVQIYRYSYPIVLGIAISVYIAVGIRRKIEGWSVKVRDEVYLVGERLHNFSDPESEKKKKAARSMADKGKARAVDPTDTSLVDTGPRFSISRGIDEGGATMNGTEDSGGSSTAQIQGL